ncbi:gas vesicle protein GvpG [Conexibacter arvalis]|uniref:Cell division protein FtsB n=1 Tax=Conexibacter arvalis TaxID=912552 RepID=A0A840IDY7_9ACTN|nr:gas vesicle protein GvpG [Conexibacter arvalis]MBB4662238.1 cell division protein FtsB [Conexibacter arvalis]
MGLIKELVLLPVAPLRFTVWVGDKLAEEVDRQHNSPAATVRELEEIEQARARGELDAEEAAQRESEALDRQLSGPGADEEGADRG